MSGSGLVLLVELTVRADALDDFHAYERAAALVMNRHGGRIERVVLVEHDVAGEHREVHVVTFPDEAAFAGYRQDPASAALQPRRAACVLQTRITRGREAPGYGPTPRR